MRLVSRLVWVLAAAVLAVGGCNDVYTPPETASFTLLVTGRGADWESKVLEGARFCQADTENCVMTDATGEGTLELPVGQEISFTFEKEGYTPHLVAGVLPSGGFEGTYGLVTDAAMADQHERVMSPYPMRGTGTIICLVTPKLEGATFDLVGATGQAFYWDEEGNWSLDFNATTSFGRGGFVEVSEGVFRIKLGGTAKNCFPAWGWPDEAKDTYRVPVWEGYVSHFQVLCPP
jgi:hypothetical protein